MGAVLCGYFKEENSSDYPELSNIAGDSTSSSSSNNQGTWRVSLGAGCYWGTFFTLNCVDDIALFLYLNYTKLTNLTLFFFQVLKSLFLVYFLNVQIFQKVQ